MSETRWKQWTQEALPVVRKTGRYILEQEGQLTAKDVEAKSLNQYVSYVDTTAEERLVDGLSTILPEAGFLTEEETVDQIDSDVRWIIDPLDGTTNFLHSLPACTVSVALEEEGELVLGVVYDLHRDHMFYASRGSGAYENQKRLRLNSERSLEESLLATGFPYYDFEYLGEYMELLEELMRETRGLRRWGSAALDLAWVASGRFDGFFEYGLHAWDVAGGIVLVQEAGGTISDFDGGDEALFAEEIIAANDTIYDIILDKIKKRIKGG